MNPLPRISTPLPRDSTPAAATQRGKARNRHERVCPASGTRLAITAGEPEGLRLWRLP